MKLLSSSEGTNKRQLDTSSQELRSVQLDTLIRGKQKEISDLDRQLMNSLSEFGKQTSEQEAIIRGRISSLTSEVESLEFRKKQALVPLEEKDKELQDKERVLEGREETVAIKESDLENKAQLLEDRLDSLSEREQSATDYSNLLNARELRIAVQEENVHKRMDAVSALMKEAFEEKKNSETELNTQRAMLKGRAVSLTEREEIVAKKEAGFANRERKILDQYHSLQKAIAETNDNRQRNQRSE